MDSPPGACLSCASGTLVCATLWLLFFSCDELTRSWQLKKTKTKWKPGLSSLREDTVTLNYSFIIRKEKKEEKKDLK